MKTWGEPDGVMKTIASSVANSWDGNRRIKIDVPHLHSIPLSKTGHSMPVPGFGMHAPNTTNDGRIDSPGTRALEWTRPRAKLVMNPVALAEADWYSYAKDRSCREIQRTPAAATASHH